MKIELPSACACLGPQFNEPECPCTMRRLNLPPSKERLEHYAWLDSPEGKAYQKDQHDKLMSIFNKN